MAVSAPPSPSQTWLLLVPLSCTVATFIPALLLILHAAEDALLDARVQWGILLLVFSGYAAGFASAAMLLMKFLKPQLQYVEVQQEPEEKLHWIEGIPRRGVGDAIDRINHIAFIVEDVGRSLAFYVEVMGFQQIRRPNFDRHGAWLTVGNTELHLIKGQPCVHDGEDLIVSHLALETQRPLEVLKKLVEMNIPFRQNVSVPDPIKARNNRSEDFSSAEGKVTQFFIRDPDGYYLEICNCDILTKFCLMKEDKLRESLANQSITYVEGMPVKRQITMGMVGKISIMMRRSKKRVRANLRRPWPERLDEALKDVTPAAGVDAKKMRALLKRQKTYCDIMQGYSDTQIAEALVMAGNDIPKAILVLKADRGDTRLAIPPSYLCPSSDERVTEVDGSLQPRRFEIPIARCDSRGSVGLATTCKPFNDRAPSKADARKHSKQPGQKDESLKDRLEQKLPGSRAASKAMTVYPDPFPGFGVLPGSVSSGSTDSPGSFGGQISTNWDMEDL